MVRCPETVLVFARADLVCFSLGSGFGEKQRRRASGATTGVCLVQEGHFVHRATLDVGIHPRSGAGRTEYQARADARTDSNETFWFVALAKEQSALITHDVFHRSPFIGLLV
jgi:hypothetical protein